MEFERRNVKLIAIAVQKIDGMLQARSFVEKHRYRFPILFDESRETTKAYGVYHLAGIDAFRIARPAALVLDREQFHRIEEMISNTSQTLQDQLEKVDRMSREVTDRVNETVDVVQDSIIRPVREVGALARGVAKGFELLMNRRDRHTVDKAHSDEELFI